LLKSRIARAEEALKVKLHQEWGKATPVVDDERLVSCAGLVPVMALAEEAGLSELVADRVSIKSSLVASAGANPAGKVATIIAGMAVGAECIDDLDLVRSGGMKEVFGGVYAPATLGQFLRSFTHGHVSQLASVARAHLVNLVERTDLLYGIEEQAFIDIDSLLRPVYGHAKQGASYGHAKIAGRSLLRKGLSPLVTTISTAASAPAVAGVRLRAGKAGSGKAAASMVTDAIRTARVCGAGKRGGKILVRGDSAFGTSAVVNACLAEGVEFSVVLAQNNAVTAAISRIPEDAWVPVHYPGAVADPDTGELISDAEVAETSYTAFPKNTPVTARLIVRRVRDRAVDGKDQELFPVWRHHPFFTNNTEPVDVADITHRRHAIIETVFADLIDGPFAHMPSGRFAANHAWTVCAAMAYNLLRAVDSLAPRTRNHQSIPARGSTLRRQIINVPARLARPQRRPVLHLPTHWPWGDRWLRTWDRVFGTAHGPPATA
jgi:hypothetical protein